MITNRLSKADPSLWEFLPPTKSVAGFVSATFDDSRAGDQIGLIVALHRDSPPEGFEKLRWRRITAGIYTVAFPKERLNALRECPDVETIYGPRPMRLTATPDPMRFSGLRPQNHPTRTGKQVVVGIIDHGFDLRHPAFLDEEENTRVAYYWDQAVKGSKGSYGYGVEYTREEINEMLKRDRHAQTPDPLCTSESEAHGTHVAGIAGGSPNAAAKKPSNAAAEEPSSDAAMEPSNAAIESSGRPGGVAPDSIFILVNLRRAGAGAHTLSIHVVQALEWIFSKADTGFEEEGEYGIMQKAAALRLSKPKRKMPCVVNLSFTDNDGGHDGYSEVERVIDGLLLVSRGRAVVVAAGNSAADNLHAEWQYRPGDTTELLWEIPPADKDSPAVHDMALWYSSRDEITAQLVSPEGVESALISPGIEDSKVVGGTSTVIQSLRFLSPGGDARIFIKLGRPVAGGTWRVKLKALSASHAGTLHGWLDNTPDKQFRGRFASHVTDHITIGSPAAARYAVSVGNIDPSAMSAVQSSGRGPTRDRRDKPEIVAPGVDITSACSRGGTKDSEGNEMPMYVAASGTSASAPHITGLIACMFEQNSELTAPQIQKILIAAADGEGHDEALGYGMADAVKALELVSNYVKRDRD
jgi:subtilisin family serine protease